MYFFNFFVNLLNNNINKLRPDMANSAYQRVSVHMVRPSPWPILTAFSLGSLLMSTVSFFHGVNYWEILFLTSLVILCSSCFFWFYDVVVEATYEGQHTSLVQLALRYGMFLFILSEVMFFVSFFWAFFHFSLSPSVSIFCVWPPRGIITLNPNHVPLLNTILLVSSGIWVTYCHYAILLNNNRRAIFSLKFTIFLGLTFTLCQLYEYIYCPFHINDSVYGSVFFMATGFHGLHVIVGTVFLIVCLFRLAYGHFNANRHLGFECAAYYWHFVDVVWLFLYSSVYWWGS